MSQKGLKKKRKGRKHINFINLSSVFGMSQIFYQWKHYYKFFSLGCINCDVVENSKIKFWL